MKKSLLWIVIIGLFSLGLGGCMPRVEPNYQKGNYLSGRTLNESSADEQDTGLNIDVKTNSEPVGILVRGILTEGQVFVSLKDPSGSIVWSSQPVGGSFNQNRLVSTLKPGSYRLYLAWNGPVQGQVDILTLVGEALRLPEVSPLGLVAGVGMLLVVAAYTYYAARHRLSWKYMGLGALVWLVAVLIKVVVAVVANRAIYRVLIDGGQPVSLGGSVFDIYVGTLTGIFEVWLVWLFVSRSQRVDKSSWKNALAFGIGFGAVEALLLGLASLTGVLLSLLNANSLSLATLESFSQTGNLLFDLAPISERIFTILVHIFSNLLIFYSAYRGKQGWMWLAFAYKTLFDSVAAYAQISGILGSLRAVWLIELIIMLFGLVGWYGISRILPLYQPPAPVVPEPGLSGDGPPVV
jgi:uncharacterized membrane protein YhfC